MADFRVTTLSFVVPFFLCFLFSSFSFKYVSLLASVLEFNF